MFYLLFFLIGFVSGQSFSLFIFYIDRKHDIRIVNKVKEILPTRKGDVISQPTQLEETIEKNDLDGVDTEFDYEN